MTTARAAAAFNCLTVKHVFGEAKSNTEWTRPFTHRSIILLEAGFATDTLPQDTTILCTIV